MAEETRKRILTRRELYISIAIPALCFGGAALGILLETRGIISEAGSFYWGSVAGSFLLAYLAWIKPRKDIVALLAPLYAVIIFIVALEAQPTILLQLLFGASLTILVVRLNILFSTPPVKKHGEDTMEQYLYDYMHRITPYYRGIDRETAHEVASAVLSFKFGLYPNSMSSAESAVSRITAGAAYETLKKALVIIRDRASSLEASEIKRYSQQTFSEDDTRFLALTIPDGQVKNREDQALDNALLLGYAVAYLCSPDDGQVLDEHQNFVIQILNPYKEALGP